MFRSDLLRFRSKPGGTSLLQQMVIAAAYSPKNLRNTAPNEVNTLGANITSTTVTSVRNGKSSTNTTWKGGG
jgi:hypothetical protein